MLPLLRPSTGKFVPDRMHHFLQTNWYEISVSASSTIAFLTIDWMSDGLNNLLFMEEALVTQNLPFSGIYSSHEAL